MTQNKLQVICLPGGVAPAAARYAPLVPLVSDHVQLHFKDLEVYREASPPRDYSVDVELVALDAFADRLGLNEFHLLSYSGGGFISLAYAGTRPQRLKSLAVFEPASIPGRLSDEEQESWDEFQAKLRGLQGAAYMGAFVRAQLKPGVEPPPPPSGPPSPEMQKRPAGIEALAQSFIAYEFDRSRFEQCEFPVFHAYGDQTHETEALRASVLARLLPDIRIRRFAGVHHFVPPERIYTPEYAEMLLAHWRRAEQLQRQLSS
jgi:pimeloyl-ACP methyl ester carboxylesterase